jgi:hypothetical protein
VTVLARFEESVVGRVVISLCLVFTLGAILVVNMPDSELKGTVSTVTAPFLNATGLDQNWGVFATPRMLSAYVDGRVDYRDGSSGVFPIPARPGLAAYSDYRWQKFEEMVRTDDNQQLWAPYAEYLANRARAEGHDPVRVSLVRRWADTLPPGPGADRGPWREFTFYVLPLKGTR